jgi:tripartite-type tricarboxylate transporter receptor subunit TctC
MRSRPTRLGLMLAACAAALAVDPQAAGAQDNHQDNFYAGKVVSIVVDGTGAYETYARTLARHLPRHIPGEPKVIVQAMPGASGIRAATYLYKIAPRDGTVIGGLRGALLTAPLFSPDVAPFDLTRFSWIGNTTRDVYVGYAWHASPVRSLEDARARQFVVGGTSLGGAGIDVALIAREVFGYNLKIVAGYKSSGETKLAVEKGEVEGQIATGLTSIKLFGWLATNKVRLIVQHGASRHRELPDVPMFRDLVRTEAERQMLDVLDVRYEIAKPYLGPPGLPPARLALLRRAFDATLRDPAHIADMQRQRLEFEEPLNGEELAALAGRIARTPPAVVQRMVTLFANYKDAK